MSKPFKMKGSPMQRNFGISPIKQLTSYTRRSGGRSTKTYEHTVESRIKDLIKKYKDWRKRNK